MTRGKYEFGTFPVHSLLTCLFICSATEFTKGQAARMASIFEYHRETHE